MTTTTAKTSPKPARILDRYKCHFCPEMIERTTLKGRPPVYCSTSCRTLAYDVDRLFHSVAAKLDEIGDDPKRLLAIRKAVKSRFQSRSNHTFNSIKGASKPTRKTIG